jgi:hypothetical protein
MNEVLKGEDTGIEIWDPTGSVTAMWIRPDILTAEETQAGTEVQRSMDAEQPSKLPKVNNPPNISKRKVAPKKSKHNQRDSRSNKDIQFEIKIEQPTALVANNDDSQ